MNNAEVRTHIYGGFALAFSFPEKQLEKEILSGRVESELRVHARQLPYSCLLNQEGSEADFQSFLSDPLPVLYSSKFEVGNPPVSLHEGTYSTQDTKKLHEDVFRFYEYFGLNFENQKLDNTPDWLISELEFMHYLGFLETLVSDEVKQGGLQRAQCDFIDRHLQWLKILVEKLRDQDVGVYLHLGTLLSDFVEADKNYLSELPSRINQ